MFTQTAMDKELARDGVRKNVKPEMLPLVARYRIDPKDLDCVFSHAIPPFSLTNHYLLSIHAAAAA